MTNKSASTFKENPEKKTELVADRENSGKFRWCRIRPLLPRTEDLFPDIPLSLFRLSLFVGVIAILCLTIPFNGEKVVRGINIGIRPTNFLFDSLLVHVYAIILLFVTVLRWFLRGHESQWIRKSIYALSFTTILVGGTLCSELKLEGVWLKPTFFFHRPPVELQKPSPWLTGYVEKKMKTDSKTPESRSATPSGFVFRQLILTFFLFIYGRRLTWLSVRRKILEIYLPALLLFFYVVFLRVWAGMHTFFDVGIAIGTGTLLFWAFWMTLCSIYGSLVGTKMPRVYFRDFLVPAVFLVFYSFIFSGHSHTWVLALLVILFVAGLGYSLGEDLNSAEHKV